MALEKVFEFFFLLKKKTWFGTVPNTYFNFGIGTPKGFKALLRKSRKSRINDDLVTFSGKLAQNSGQNPGSNIFFPARTQKKLLQVVESIISGMDFGQVLISVSVRRNRLAARRSRSDTYYTNSKYIHSVKYMNFSPFQFYVKSILVYLECQKCHFNFSELLQYFWPEI